MRWSNAALAFAVLALVALVKPHAGKAQNDMAVCRLTRSGDCCSVTIDHGHGIHVSTNIDSATMTNFILIRNKSQSSCAYTYNGEARVPMRAPANNYIGTWLGDDFSLQYLGDSLLDGSCRLDIYYMSIGQFFPEQCQAGHFTSPVAQ